MMLKIKGKYKWGVNTGCPHHTLARYRLSCCEWHDRECFSKTYLLIVKKLENEIMYCKETVEC
jgi:hypothetical protein